MKTEAEIRQELTERAERLFGKPRTEELRADIEQIAAETMKIMTFPVGVDDEP